MTCVAGLDSLLGVHSVEGVREVTEADGTNVILMRLDGEVRAAFVRGSSDLVQVSRLRDRRWPFLPDHICQLHGEEMESADGETLLVCNFLRRPPDLESRLEPRLGSGIRRGEPLPAQGQIAAFLTELEVPHELTDQSNHRGWILPAARRVGVVREPSLVAIDEDRNLIVLEIRATPSDLLMLPLNTGLVVPPGATVQITVRSQFVTFHVRRMIIGCVPADWIVNDVLIGNRSQFIQSGDVPGEMFATASIDSFETVQTSTDVVVVVTYIGPNPEGSTFTGALIGNSSSVPSVSLRWIPEGYFEPWLAGSLDSTGLTDNALS